MKNGQLQDTRFRQSLDPSPGTALKLHEEPTEPILIFGEIVRDVGVMKDMLTGLAFSGKDEYRRNLQVVRSAAERVIKRSDRLIGDEPAKPA